MTLGKFGWLLLAFAGMLLITQTSSENDGTNYLAGIALALGAAFLYAMPHSSPSS